MKNSLKSLVLAGLTPCALLVAAANLNAAQVAVAPTSPWQGFMNVLNLPSAGGAYQFGSGWGIPDLTATWSGNVLTLGPNTINDPANYWYTPAGGPGATGNKIMDANIYVETTGKYSGQSLTFSGNVLANTLVGKKDPNGNGWTSVAFIKDFAPDYSSSVSVTAPLVNGGFSLSLAILADPTRHVQYGFETIGPDVWSTDVGPYGSIQVVPEPSSLALLGLGCVGTLIWRRRQ